MIDDLVKAYPHHRLGSTRQASARKLDGRVEHRAAGEAGQFGEVFGHDGGAVRNPDLVAVRR